ncbi:FHIPEP family type III secretion protein [bacterium]|nr:FHIPEP family type III secretion protein [bacterium]
MNIFLCATICIFVVVLFFMVLMFCKIKALSRMVMELKNQSKEFQEDTKIYENLKVDVIVLEMGKNLLRFENKLSDKINILRQKFADELGYIVPEVKIRENNNLAVDEIAIMVHDLRVLKTTIYSDRLLTLLFDYEKNNQNVPSDKIPAVGAYNKEVCWITKKDYHKLSKSIQSKEAIDVIIDFLEEIIIEKVDDILSVKEVYKYIKYVKENYSSEVVDVVLGEISVNKFKEILTHLLREKISIKDINFIFDKLSGIVQYSQSPCLLAEMIRTFLSQQILNRNAIYNTLFAIVISPAWEKLLQESCDETELGHILLLSPPQMQYFIDDFMSVLSKATKDINFQPVVLCTPKVRYALFSLLSRYVPDIAVIAYSELLPKLEIQALDTIGNNDSYEKIVNME